MPYAETDGLPGKIPILGPPAEVPIDWVLPIPWGGIAIIAEKIARDCEYKYENLKRFVEAPYGIRTFVCDSAFAPEPFASAGRILDFGPGCKIRRVFFTEDPNEVVYYISIWNTLNLKVWIGLETEMLKAEQEFRKCEGRIPPDNGGMKISRYLRNVNQQEP